MAEQGEICLPCSLLGRAGTGVVTDKWPPLGLLKTTKSSPSSALLCHNMEIFYQFRSNGSYFSIRWKSFWYITNYVTYGLDSIPYWISNTNFWSHFLCLHVYLKHGFTQKENTTKSHILTGKQSWKLKVRIVSEKESEPCSEARLFPLALAHRPGCTLLCCPTWLSLHPCVPCTCPVLVFLSVLLYIAQPLHHLLLSIALKCFQLKCCGILREFWLCVYSEGSLTMTAFD